MTAGNSPIPDDTNRTDLTREDLERVRRMTQEEADLERWSIRFGEERQPDGLWTLRTRYDRSLVGTVNPNLPSVPPAAGMDGPDPSPDGPPGAFVAARRILPNAVLYVDAEGREVVREGGSRSWRNCNNGNIRKGDFAANAGSIGDDGSFAIFPDEGVGFAATVTLLRTPAYSRLTLKEAIFRYAPPTENNSDAYADFIASKTGIALDEKLSDITSKTRIIAKFIQEMEGWTPGTMRPNAPLSGGGPTQGSSPVGVSAAVGAAQDWMAIAEAEAALPLRDRSPWPDPEENPHIVDYFRTGAFWVEGSDETDWCAAFVNYCLVRSGYVGTEHPGARSFIWNKKGQFVRLNSPRKGAIAVRRYAPMSDAAWKTGKGHVGFVVSSTPSHVTLLGGNQSSTVCVQTYPLEEKGNKGNILSKFVAFMMPVI